MVGFKVTVLLLWIVVGVAAVALNNSASTTGRGCGTYVEPQKKVTFERQLRELQRRQVAGSVTITPATFDIVWTVVTVNETAKGGHIPMSQIEAQIQVLNKDYAKAQISWRLGGVQYVINRDWFEDAAYGTRQEKEMKYLFRSGDASVLNVYTLMPPADSTIITLKPTTTLGYSTLPQWYTDDPVMDGIVILFTTLPGGALERFNFGRTLTHEAGHWLGLYHTFEGDTCLGDGDFVDDTPAEEEESRGCPVGRDTCSGGGPDPVQNFMDYSDDQCMTGFTPGQIERMHYFIQNYRQPTATNFTFPYSNSTSSRIPW